jgi:threonine aldolase
MFMSASKFDFHSDNASGIHPAIVESLLASNSGFTEPYGSDPLTDQVNNVFSQLFERETFVFSVPTGTAANGLALGAITPSYGALFSHENAHIVTTECGAPEFFSCGARIITLSGRDDKITAETLEQALSTFTPGNKHQLLPSSISLTQATESGAVYSSDEIAAISDRARSAKLRVHMDGARFANAMVHLNVTPAEMTWKSGVDVVSFGTTKNGTMNAEAILVFDPDLARTVRYLHKRAGFLASKMRFQSAQLLAYLDQDLWLENATRANRHAQRIAAALRSVPRTQLSTPVQSNIIFAQLADDLAQSFSSRGINLRPWKAAGPNAYRIVTSWNDSEELLTAFVGACATESKKAAPSTAR